MKKLIVWIHWVYDYYFHEYLFGPFKQSEYETYMFEKWGDRYASHYIKNVHDKDFKEE